MPQKIRFWQHGVSNNENFNDFDICKCVAFLYQNYGNFGVFNQNRIKYKDIRFLKSKAIGCFFLFLGKFICH